MFVKIYSKFSYLLRFIQNSHLFVIVQVFGSEICTGGIYEMT